MEFENRWFEVSTSRWGGRPRGFAFHRPWPEPQPGGLRWWWTFALGRFHVEVARKNKGVMD